jgi:hypothetical protein
MPRLWPMILPSQEGTYGPGDAAASASAAEGYSSPIDVICATKAIARSFGAEQRATPQATPAGSPNLRTRTTFAGLVQN